MPNPSDDDTKVTKLFVWGNNDKWQLGMDNQEDHNNSGATDE